MRKWFWVISSFVLFALAACQSTPEQKYSLSGNLLLDEAYPEFKQVNIESSDQIFSLNDAMRDYVDTTLTPIKDQEARATQLVADVFQRSNGRLLYDNSANYIASDTYEIGAANCLSLTILTYTLAREADLAVNFQEIDIPEYWTHREGFSMLNGHVNLVIIKRQQGQEVFLRSRGFEVDFDPYASKKRFGRTTVDKSRIVAMFYNNKGAEALLDKDYTSAYAFLRQSILTDDQFSPAYGNLGLLYRINGQHKQAELVYRHALKIDEDSLNIWGNLAVLLKLQGKQFEAQQISQRLEQKRQGNPYYHFVLGHESYYKGHWQQAITHFKRAVKIERNEHEFYFGLARSYYQLGNTQQSERFLKLAKRHAGAEDIEQLYQSKLQLLHKNRDYEFSN